MKVLHIAGVLISVIIFALQIGLAAVGVCWLFRCSLIRERTFNRGVALGVLLAILSLDAVLAYGATPGWLFIPWVLLHLPSEPLFMVLGLLIGNHGAPYMMVGYSLFSALFWAVLLSYVFRRKLPPEQL
jgi:hypothetical protein